MLPSRRRARGLSIYLQVIGVLFLLLGIGSIVVGLYNAIHFPFDYSDQQALVHASACPTTLSQSCVAMVTATVVQVYDDGGDEETLVARVGDQDVSLDAIQSYDTMARLYTGESIQLLRWRGRYVHVVTPAGAFDTNDNPSYPVSQDAAFGIVGILLGAIILAIFGRMVLSPLFIALGWRRLATSTDRDTDDVRHGIIPPARPITSYRSYRWMERYARWDGAHLVLSTLLTMVVTTTFAAARIWGNAGGWGGPQGFADTPHWPIVLAIAAGLGLVLSLASRRRLRQTSAEVREGEDLQRRLAEVSAWPDGPDKHAALIEVAGSLQEMSGRRGMRRSASRRSTRGQ